MECFLVILSPARLVSPSPPHLVSLPQIGVTVENIDRKHVLRNKLIANSLYDIYYIEKWDTGITKMRRLIREHGLAEPMLEDLGRRSVGIG